MKVPPALAKVKDDASCSQSNHADVPTGTWAAPGATMNSPSRTAGRRDMGKLLLQSLLGNFGHLRGNSSGELWREGLTGEDQLEGG